MKVVYVAGRFRADTHWEIVQNVRNAEAYALTVWRNGGAALCPHLNTANFQGAAPDEVWIEGTLELLRRCDALLTVPGYTSSKGTLGEIDEAKRLGIPVFHVIGNLVEWLRTPTSPETPVGPGSTKPRICYCSPEWGDYGACPAVSQGKPCPAATPESPGGESEGGKRP